MLDDGIDRAAFRHEVIQNGTHCPACGAMMRAPSAESQFNGLTTRTKAHLQPRTRGRKPDAWFFACRRCNEEQGHLTLDEWLIVLIYQDDKRVTKVGRIVLSAVRYGLLEPPLTLLSTLKAKGIR